MNSYFRCLLLATFSAQIALPQDTLDKIRSNDLTWLANAMQSKEKVDQRDAKQNTALIWAAALGSTEAVQLLIERGADVNAANGLGVTPLIAAATDEAKVKILLAAGADVKATSKMGRNALIIAASSPAAIGSMRLLLEKGAQVNSSSAQKTTPILSALGGTYCAPEQVDLLLASGADVKAEDSAGNAVMHGAILCPPKQIKGLIGKGALLNASNSFGGKVKFGNIELVGLTPLMLAAPYASAAEIQLLLDLGADPNAVDSRGMNSLHFAVSSETQNIDVVKLLLGKGADKSRKDKYGQTPLDWARKFNDPKVTAALGAKAITLTNSKPQANASFSVQRSITLLEKTGSEFFKTSGCLACHHSNLTAHAVRVAKGKSVVADSPFLNEIAAINKGFLASISPTLLQQVGPGGAVDTMLYALLGADASNSPSNPDLEIAANYIAVQQLPAGQWAFGGISRSPIEEGNLHRTALAVRLLPRYTNEAQKPKRKRQVELARRWMENEPAKTLDDKAMKLLGLAWSGSSVDHLNKAAAELERAQRSDGGWGGNRNLGSEAYSTGLALYALAVGANRPAKTKSVAAGRRYLESTQLADGSWHVHSRSDKFQPYFESGFPHGQDQWISSAATAWAVAGWSASR